MQVQSIEQAQAMIAELQAKLAIANKPRAITLKVSDKGAVSVYGMGRFPVTLYAGQMERLLNAGDDIRAFMVTNKALLSVKA